MKLDLEQPGSLDWYELATHLVVPRPIAWVMTQNEAKLTNLAPFSYFGIMSDDPILLALSIGRKTHPDGSLTQKDTTRNLLTTGQAVVHLVEKERLTSMMASSANLPAATSEVEHLGLETETSIKVAPPRLKSVSFALECVVERHLEIGNEPNDLFLLRAVEAILSDEALEQGLPNAEKIGIVGKLGGKDYTIVSRALERQRP